MIYPGQVLTLPCWMNDSLCVINREQFQKYAEPCCSSNHSETDEDFETSDCHQVSENETEPIQLKSENQKTIKSFRSEFFFLFA